MAFTSIRYSFAIAGIATTSLFRFQCKPSVVQLGHKEDFRGKELMFYVLIVLLLLFALLKMLLPKYFNDLFRFFFRTTLKQRQIKEQLMQTPLPSLILNVFFVVSGRIISLFLLQHYQIESSQKFLVVVSLLCQPDLLSFICKVFGLKFTAGC